MAAPSAMRRTAESLIAAFNRMDIPAIISHRSPTCMRQILPKSLGFASHGNDAYRRSLERLIPIFNNFSLVAHDFVEDPAERKITVCLRARADTAVGEYINEYIWILHFDEQGTSIEDVKEFVDVGVYRDFWPKLAAAIEAEKAKKQAVKEVGLPV